MVVLNAKGPSYLPPGYALSGEGEGADIAGLGRISDQIGLFFRRRVAPDDWRNPLVVFVGPPYAPALTATEKREGEVVDLGFDGVTAVYHDGMWQLGPGSDEVEVGPPDQRYALHWDNSVAHSITVRWPSGTIAVRGSRAAGIGYNDLVQVTHSMFGVDVVP